MYSLGLKLYIKIFIILLPSFNSYHYFYGRIMKNITLSILFVATCQLMTATGLQQTSVEANAQLRLCMVEEAHIATPQKALFRKVEDTPVLVEQELNTEFRVVSERNTFSPFYFVRKVDIRSRSTLDADHILQG